MVKSLPTNAGHADSIPGAESSPGEGNGNLLQYSCLGNPMDRGGWQATVYGVAKELDKMTKQQCGEYTSLGLVFVSILHCVTKNVL